MSAWLRMRRPLDWLAALLIMIPAAPLVAVLAALVRRQDGGPAFVRLTRVGRNGTSFTMFKLRTMRTGASSDRAGGPPITAANDDRITPLGRHLRRHRLDELPQLVNVLRGDMAMLGPRPETPEYVDPSSPAWMEVLRARPGIAGPTQLLVHDWEESALGDARADLYKELALPVKLACDAWYVRSASPGIDVLVIVGLLARFVGGRPSSRLRARLERDVGDVVRQWPPDLGGIGTASGVTERAP